MYSWKNEEKAKWDVTILQTINHNIQSPEVTSKAASDDESVKSLSEKLSEALVNIREKEDLVKQHAKVAEEAVSGITQNPCDYAYRFFSSNTYKFKLLFLETNDIFQLIPLK